MSVRSYRGVVRWVLRPHRARSTLGFRPPDHRVAYRSPWPDITKDPGRPKGTCAWCWTKLTRPKYSRANYHPDCAQIMACMKGQREMGMGGWVIPLKDAVCRCGAQEGRFELDHRLALSLGARMGLDTWVRAFLPDNLEWLCVDCHKKKTKLDLAKLNALKHGLHPGEQRRMRRKSDSHPEGRQGLLIPLYPD